MCVEHSVTVTVTLFLKNMMMMMMMMDEEDDNANDDTAESRFPEPPSLYIMHSYIYINVICDEATAILIIIQRQFQVFNGFPVVNW